MSIPPNRNRDVQQERAPGFQPVRLVATTFCIAGLVAGVWFTLNSTMRDRTGSGFGNAQAPPASVPRAVPTSTPTLPIEPSPNIELTTAASIQRQQLAAAKFKQRQTIAVFEEVKQALDEWERELRAWEQVGPPLLRNDDGKRVATDGTLVKQFRVVIDQDRPTREILTASRKQAEDLISPVRESEQNAEDASLPPEQTTKTLREIQTKARKARDSYRDAQGTVEGLLAQATAPRGGGTAGEKTLEQAIAAQRQEEALGRAAVIEAEAKKAWDEGTQLIAGEKAKLIRLQSEMDASRLREEAERKRQGPIRSGTTWKGTMRLVDSTASSTLTIARRVGDSIEGTVSWTESGSTATIRFSTGKVTGNTVKFTCEKVVRGAAEAGFTYNAVLDPVTGTLSGTAVKDNRLGATYAYRLSTGEE
jgi:hypothetical protein